MNVLLIFDGDFPWDIRIEKICDSLLTKGMPVTLLCRNESKRKVYEKLKGIVINRLPVFPGVFNYLLTFPLFCNPIWVYSIYKLARNGTDVIVVRDLPLALTAVFVGKMLRIPVVYDMAEPYPEGLRSNWQYDNLKLKDYIVRNPAFADILEKIVLKYLDFLWVVSEESLHRAVFRGCEKKKICIVGNTPRLKQFDEYPKKKFPGKMELLKGRFVFIFAGYLLGDRGLDIAIKALQRLKSIDPVFSLFIIGTGPREAELKDLVTDLNLEKDVIFSGWIKNEEIHDYLVNADMGILPFKNCAHINITLANKLFDYMLVGLPVFASSVKPMKRIIHETNSGVLFVPEDIQSFVDSAMDVYKNKEMLKKMGESGVLSVKTKYSWEHDEKLIFSSLNSLIL